MSHTHTRMHAPTHTGGGWTDEAEQGKQKLACLSNWSLSSSMSHTRTHTHTHTGGGWTEEAKSRWEVCGGGGSRTEIDLSDWSLSSPMSHKHTHIHRWWTG